MKQSTLFDLEAFTNSPIPSPLYDPFWDEIEIAPEKTHSVGGQITELDFPYKSVGEQVTTDTLKSAPQHDTHWVEKYWVKRSSNKYWYYRYCWMTGRKIHRIYLGSVDRIKAKKLKQAVETAMASPAAGIANGKLPIDLKHLIPGWKNESPPCPKCKRTRLIFKNGTYKLSDNTVVQRWFCQRCRKSFSSSTSEETPAPVSETSAVHPRRGY